MEAGFTRSADTVTCRPHTTVLSVLSVWATVWWFQCAAYGVLPQEYVGQVPEIPVEKCGQGCVVCCWGSSQLVHVAAELLFEDVCLDLWGGWNQELTRNMQGLAIDKLCCG
jgi:hypothetical protein